ncbi:MAG: hypothetical protein J1F16_05785 [Muribaculaceae bacterium]|nr:hypothetical protein [Muribaculaceae bacterium]
MKTLSNLVREIFKTGKRIKPPVDRNTDIIPEEMPEMTPASENQPNNQPPKQSQNETENLEVAGNPGLDTARNTEILQNALQSDQGNPEPGNEKVCESGNPATGESESGNTIPGEESKELSGDLDREKAIKEAYRQGELAARNARIEERYFPRKEDGIPAFRGKPSAMRPAADIFSMAREA